MVAYDMIQSKQAMFRAISYKPIQPIPNHSLGGTLYILRGNSFP